MSIKGSHIDHQTPSCPHLIAFRSRNGPKPYHLLHDCLRFRPISGTFSIRREPQSEIPRCTVCSSTGLRLYACLTCADILCHLVAPSPSHAAAHVASSPGHEIFVDVDRAELFCCACCDQVYDRDFDAAVVLSCVSSHSPIPENPRKRRRDDYPSWIGYKGRTALEKHFTDSGNASDEHPSGLRGLNNLGNTCFMNSVLQALLHTPIRNYSSDQHNRYHCQIKGTAGVCLSCDMDAIYSAVFTGDKSPYSPAKFLFSWWQHAANLASYDQQDAHEFFISMLDGIHQNSHREKRKNHSQGLGECCVAHKLFSGVLQSDVMCMSCGFTSTTYDPCVDISLELESQTGSSKPSAKNQPESTSISTLIGCLDRFTRPERLGADQKFFCQKCQVSQESLKQMSIRKLPLVSCFHIKRFEHLSVRKMSRKVDKYLQFPFSLDMAPYLSSSILRERFGNRVLSEPESSPEMSSEFELFAVITHTGKLDTGHYVTYVRRSNKWYKCDDAWITQVNENIVRAAQGYMMFYVQRMLFCSANVK